MCSDEAFLDLDLSIHSADCLLETFPSAHFCWLGLFELRMERYPQGSLTAASFHPDSFFSSLPLCVCPSLEWEWGLELGNAELAFLEEPNVKPKGLSYWHGHLLCAIAWPSILTSWLPFSRKDQWGQDFLKEAGREQVHCSKNSLLMSIRQPFFKDN